ncbi:uncharacterized protein LOC110845035 [Folsomia candida]|uniref:uncharacterized protein LOC110845035 n=1 Tax=Folsomia candida TaxID=158441 RepID=UPI001604BD76|nr:uncharacterized protein LOC110845035 [Folsomia candida]XP_035704025.1 uncharacterized protein LOC110845035 [Folsomia candida]
MAGYTFYPEELDIIHQQNSFNQARNKSFFSALNFNLIKPSAKENVPNSGRITRLFRPLRIILTLLGRWPFQPQPQDVTTISSISSSSRTSPLSQIIEPDLAWIEQRAAAGSRFGQPLPSDPTISPTIPVYDLYTGSLKSGVVFWMYFILTTLFLSTVLLFSVLGFCDFFLDWRLFAVSSWDEEEKRNFESNLVPFVLVWSCLLHSSISSISFIIKRKTVAKFLNYWNFAIDSMDIDVPKGIKRYVLMNHAFFLSFLIIIFIAYRILCLNLIRGGSVLVGILTVRPVIFLFDSTQGLFKIRIFGMVVILYSVYASRAFLLLFSFKSKLLRHAFKIWNKRLKMLIRSSPTATYTDEKLRCEKAFEDYRVLLKLVRLTDQVFGMVLQSYYGSQLLNMCFELYYLARSGTYNKTPLEILAALIVLVQNIYIFFTVSLDAANVNEEAMRGLEILRRTGISQNQSIHRKYLMANMQIIFTQKIVLSGGKYFSVDRPFIVTVLGAVFTYFIIVLQVGPSLHKKIEES